MAIVYGRVPSHRNVTGRLTSLVDSDLSPVELSQALAEKLNVRVQEAIKQNRDRIDLSRVQAEELCYALSLLIEQMEWASHELFPKHASATLTNFAIRDYDRWKDLYKALRRRYRDLATKFTQFHSVLSEEKTTALFEQLDKRIITEVFRARERRHQS